MTTDETLRQTIDRYEREVRALRAAVLAEEEALAEVRDRLLALAKGWDDSARISREYADAQREANLYTEECRVAARVRQACAGAVRAVLGDSR